MKYILKEEKIVIFNETVYNSIKEIGINPFTAPDIYLRLPQLLQHTAMDIFIQIDRIKCAHSRRA